MIKKIGESNDSSCTTKIELGGKTEKLSHFIDTHAKKIHYYLDSFKCGKIECTFCKPIRMPKPIWDDISKRPRFLPLLEPINIESWEKDKNLMKYKSFNELKYKEADEIYRPSYVQKPKFDSEPFKGKKKCDTSLAKSTKPNGTKKLPNSLWHVNNARYTVNCQNCH